MKKLSFFALSLLLSTFFVFTSCDDDDDPSDMQELSIVETALATPDLSSLVAALQQANLVSDLEGPGPFTVFAPTNAAFQALLDSNPAWNSLSDIDDATLTSVLLFHVTSGETRAADLTDTYVNTLSTGPNSEPISLQISVTGGVTFNGSAAPSLTDVEASNGVVHIIDEVMLPPNVVNFALNNPDFSSLVAALTRADLSTDYVTVLSGDGPFTVFAPTNAAFQALLDSNNEWSTLADIPVETLTAVLNYHVVSGANVQEDQLSNNQDISTLGGTLTTDLTSGAKLETTSGQSVDIVLTDVQGTNGVIHVVNSVLLP
ncbi:MAG: fasciclin domain-containing protein [Bacteroidota bacterium]